MYNTGRGAEAGWGRRARWWAVKWQWRRKRSWGGRRMLHLPLLPPLTVFGRAVSLTRTAISTLYTGTKDPQIFWFGQLMWHQCRKLELAEGLPRGSLISLHDSLRRYIFIVEKHNTQMLLQCIGMDRALRVKLLEELSPICINPKIGGFLTNMPRKSLMRRGSFLLLVATQSKQPCSQL